MAQQNRGDQPIQDVLSSRKVLLVEKGILELDVVTLQKMLVGSIKISGKDGIFVCE